MRSLAKRYDVSDVALAKWCKKLRVPVPGRGYWAKKAAGHAVKVTPLKPLPTSASPSAQRIISSPRIPSQSVQESEPEVIRMQREFEARPENLIVVSDSLRSPHEFVRRTLQARGDIKIGTGYVGFDRQAHLDIHVSRPLLNRALRIMDALLKALDERGFVASLGKGDDDRQTYALAHDHRLAFGMREGTKRIENEPPKKHRGHNGTWYTPFYSKYRFVPTGRLTLFIRSWHSGYFRTWSDGKLQRIEDCLNDFIVVIVIRAEEQRELEQRREEWRREREREEQRRYEEQQLKVREAARVQELEEEASNWSKSHNLRAYLAAVREIAEERDGGLHPDSELAKWIAWGSVYADSIDPLRVSEHLERDPEAPQTVHEQ